MYGWLWRYLPGPTWLRVLLVIALIAAVVVICFEWLFPLISPFMPFNQGTVGDQ